MCDYTFYIEDYQGSNIPSESFGKYVERADYNLKRMIQNRTVESYFEQQYNLALCEIADYYYESDLEHGKIVNSESVGNYSVNYAIQPYRDYDLAMSYLGNTGLMNTAVYVT